MLWKHGVIQFGAISKNVLSRDCFVASWQFRVRIPKALESLMGAQNLGLRTWVGVKILPILPNHGR
jgi:hypothetical protein